jgi:hypothetical protein
MATVALKVVEGVDIMLPENRPCEDFYRFNMKRDGRSEARINAFTAECRETAEMKQQIARKVAHRLNDNKVADSMTLQTFMFCLAMYSATYHGKIVWMHGAQSFAVAMWIWCLYALLCVVVLCIFGDRPVMITKTDGCLVEFDGPPIGPRTRGDYIRYYAFKIVLIFVPLIAAYCIAH